MSLLKILRATVLYGLVLTAGSSVMAAPETQNPLEKLEASGADWGIWIENGLVNPGEAVRMTVSVPLSIPYTNLPALLEVHPRYLEEAQKPVEELHLDWEKISKENLWRARVRYRPRQAGNYFAAIQLYGREIWVCSTICG